jgi:hypothetical protein
LGKLSRDSGHIRVPDPPHMITGRILGIYCRVSLVPLVPTKPGVFWANSYERTATALWRAFTTGRTSSSWRLALILAPLEAPDAVPDRVVPLCIERHIKPSLIV